METSALMGKNVAQLIVDDYLDVAEKVEEKMGEKTDEKWDDNQEVVGQQELLGPVKDL